jgi:hypothetical protein
MMVNVILCSKKLAFVKTGENADSWYIAIAFQSWSLCQDDRPSLRTGDLAKLWRSILELSVKAGCEIIITHNTRDFAGVEQFGLKLLEPSEFLRLIGKLP